MIFDTFRWCYFITNDYINLFIHSLLNTSFFKIVSSIPFLSFFLFSSLFTIHKFSLHPLTFSHLNSLFSPLQVFYHLYHARAAASIKNITIVRVEQVAPFPYDLLGPAILKFPNGTYVCECVSLCVCVCVCVCVCGWVCVGVGVRCSPLFSLSFYTFPLIMLFSTFCF